MSNTTEEKGESIGEVDQLTMKLYDEDGAAKYAKMMSSDEEMSFYIDDMKKMATLVVEASKDLSKPTVLDIGCGSGDILKLLEDNLASQAPSANIALHGVDPSESMRSHAVKKLPNAVFYEGDAENIPPPDNTGNLAGVMCTFVIHHLPWTRAQGALKLFCSLLAPSAPLYLAFWEGEHEAKMDYGDIPDPPTAYKFKEGLVHASVLENAGMKLLSSRMDSYEWGNMGFAMFIKQ